MHPYLTWNIGPQGFVKPFPWCELISCVCSQLLACVCCTVLLIHHNSRNKSPLFHWVAPLFFITLAYHALAKAFICLSQHEGLLGVFFQHKRKGQVFQKKSLVNNKKTWNCSWLLELSTYTLKTCLSNSHYRFFSGFRMQVSLGQALLFSFKCDLLFTLFKRFQA